MKTEQEADFKDAQALAVYVGTPREGESREDDLGLTDFLPRALGRKIPCLVYIAPDYPAQPLKQLGINPKIVANNEEFATQLQEDLKKLIVPK